MSRSRIYLWRTTLREGRLSESGSGVVGFVPVEMAPNAPIPAMDNSFGGSAIEIGLAGDRRLKVPASLPSPELRRLIRVVEGA